MKLLKRALMVIGAIALLVIVYYGYNIIRSRYEISAMRPVDTGKINEDVLVVRDKAVNVFFIRCGNGYISIDAGIDIKTVKQGMNKLNIDPEKVRAVFLTHTDSDHDGAIRLFSNAKVYISKEEEQMINGKTVRQAFIIKNSLDASYSKLEDGQTIEVQGVKVKCILTPGHTPGSMSYLLNDRYLFTGDALSLKNKKVELGNKFFNMDNKEDGNSIHKLAKISGVDYIFTQHYGYTKDPEYAMKDWIKDTSK